MKKFLQYSLLFTLLISAIECTRQRDFLTCDTQYEEFKQMILPDTIVKINEVYLQENCKIVREINCKALGCANWEAMSTPMQEVREIQYTKNGHTNTTVLLNSSKIYKQWQQDNKSVTILKGNFRDDPKVKWIAIIGDGTHLMIMSQKTQAIDQIPRIWEIDDIKLETLGTACIFSNKSKKSTFKALIMTEANLIQSLI